MQDTNSGGANGDATSNDTSTPPKKRRGFAAMDPALVREISRRGGKAAHVAGTAHEFTHEEAREAGRKGGKATHRKRGTGGGGGESTP